jgi:hypothetical protein
MTVLTIQRTSPSHPLIHELTALIHSVPADSFRGKTRDGGAVGLALAVYRGYFPIIDGSIFQLAVQNKWHLLGLPESVNA